MNLRERLGAGRLRAVPRPTRRRLRAAAWLAALVAVGFAALLAWDLYSIKRDLDAGRRRLDTLTLDAATSTGLTQLAEDAAGHLRSGADRSHRSVPLRVLSLVPGIDDQVEGVRGMADVAADLGTTAALAAQRIDDQLERAGEPSGRIELLDVAVEELDRVGASLDEVDLGPATGLAPPLRDAHDDLGEALRDARAKVDDALALIEPVREMLAGPSTFLLLAANNAEMTGGAGMTLSVGAIEFRDGAFELGEVVRAGALRLPSSIDIPDNIREIYRPTGVGIDLRSTMRSPDLATMGPIALDIMAEYGFTDIDGVIVIDAVALAGLMEVTGDVTVDDEVITADNVLAKILHDNYVEFDAAGGPRAERVEYQGEIAKEIFATLTSGDVAPIDLADALLTAGEGRHLMLWAEDDDLQSVWSELLVDGALNELGLMISFQNYGANKMDWYLRPSATMDVDLLPSGDYRAILTMTMPVPAAEDLTDASPYILGPGPDTHGVFLTVHLPRDAYDIVSPDPGAFRTKGVEPPMQVRTFLTDVPLGTTFERTIEFSLPRSVSALLLLPSARLEPLTLTVDGVPVEDAVPVPITWFAALPPPGGDGDVSPWVRVPALTGLAATVVATGAMAMSLRARPAGRRGAVPLLPVAGVAAAAALAVLAAAALVALALSLTGPRF